MYLESLIILMVTLLFVSVFGYISVILKEKIYLSNDMVVIHNKNISQEDIDNVDIRYFSIGNIEMMTGDEIKIYRINLSSVKGMVIGANIRKKTILLAAHNNELIEVCINGIKKIKVISRYGKFIKNS